MPAFYSYGFAIFGTDSSDGSGEPIDYTSYPSGTWQYSGTGTTFVVQERNQNNATFDGDKPADTVSSSNRIGRGNAQTTDINGTDTQLLWDYSFQVSDTDGNTWEIGVVDVDLNNDNNVDDTTEAGYYLIFIDGVPPANVVLNVDGVTADQTKIDHADLGGVFVCFAAGTLIDTASGPKPVETLKAGDMVITRDAGAQPLRWVGQSRVPATGKSAPIVISKGTFGNDRDLIVSPQHAILLQDWRAELLYGSADVLVRAVDLVGMDGVHQQPGDVVTYCHILFDRHQLVRASGLWSESLYPGDMTLQTVNLTARREIEELFPNLEGYGPKAARCLRRFEAVCLAA